MDGIKETQCTCCNHLQVCSFREQYLAAQKAVDAVMVHNSDHSSICLSDISWIRPVKLECSHFLGKVPVVRDSSKSIVTRAAQPPAARFKAFLESNGFMEDPT